MTQEAREALESLVEAARGIPPHDVRLRLPTSAILWFIRGLMASRGGELNVLEVYWTMRDAGIPSHAWETAARQPDTPRRRVVLNRWLNAWR